MPLPRLTLLAATLVGCAVTHAPASAQDPPQTQTGLFSGALAGQSVAALPLTHLIRDTLVQDPAVLRERPAVLAWADSLIGDALLVGAPEVNWVLTPELRRLARRSAGMVPEPERMGQAVMRAPDLTTVPDPLRSSLRTMVAIAGGRHAFIAASLALALDEEGAVRATLTAVVADARLGRVVWRSDGIGSGATVGAAIRAAVASFFPTQGP